MSARRALGVSALLAASTLQAQSLAPFQLVRSDEDWRVLRDHPDAAPAYKYQALTDDGAIWISFGGEVRERLDTLDAPRYGIQRKADNYLLQRVMMHADLHLGERVRVFAQLSGDDAVGKKSPLAPSDTDRGDVQNLFVDVNAGAARWRFGRQELLFNPTQRFVSVREGPNVRQSFDGGRATWHLGGWAVDAFAMQPVRYAAGAFDDRNDNHQAFYGAYASTTLAASARVDAYVMGLQRDAVAFGTDHGDERRDSAGLRLAGQHGRVDYDLEGLTQWGRLGAADIHAWGFGAIAGYTFAGTLAPRWGLEADVGSGDDARRANRVGTFNPLFPKGAYFDESGLLSWANSIVLRPSFSLQPRANLSLRASVIAHWRENVRDAVYLQPYAALPQTLGNTARRVGQAYELDATWRCGRGLSVNAEIAHHEAGPAITRAGGRDSDFAMLSAQFRY